MKLTDHEKLSLRSNYYDSANEDNQPSPFDGDSLSDEELDELESRVNAEALAEQIYRAELIEFEEAKGKLQALSHANRSDDEPPF